MHLIPKSSRVVTIIAWLVLTLGLLMLIYWGLYLMRRMPTENIPILSESMTALLAFITGVGLLRRRPWAVPSCLFLSGMWAYGVIGGIALVFQQGLAFDSPFGSITDALMFPLILLYALWMATTVWKNRQEFPGTD